MKKHILAFLIASTLLAGCGGSESSSEPTTSPGIVETTITETTIAETTVAETSVPETTIAETQSGLEALEAVGDISVEKELFDVKLTLPAEYVGETTQDELDAIAKENGYKITLHDDGSATYEMNKSQHKEMMVSITDTINQALNELIGSEDYPTFTDIQANSDFTEFTITTTSTELNFNESLSVLLFYTYGGTYNIFNGTPVDNIHLDFVNADSGKIISSSDSENLGD